MSQSIIRSIYETRLKTWADANRYKVAWENDVEFKPPNTVYLSSQLIPNITLSDDLEGLHRAYTGIYQVSVHALKTDGPGPAERLAESIMLQFPNNLSLEKSGVRVQIVSPMTIVRPIEDQDRYTVPVWFRYRSDLDQ